MNGGGRHTASITEWNPAIRQGLVTDAYGVHSLIGSNCTTRLLAKLTDMVIPPDSPVEVTFDLAVTNEAINVDLADGIDVASSYEH